MQGHASPLPEPVPVLGLDYMLSHSTKFLQRHRLFGSVILTRSHGRDTQSRNEWLGRSAYRGTANANVSTGITPRVWHHNRDIEWCWRGWTTRYLDSNMNNPALNLINLRPRYEYATGPIRFAGRGTVQNCAVSACDPVARDSSGIAPSAQEIYDWPPEP